MMRRILQSFVPFLTFFLLLSGFLIWAHFLIEEKSQTELVVQIQDNSPENDTDEATSKILTSIFLLAANQEQSGSQKLQELFYSTSNLVEAPHSLTAKQVNDLLALSLLLSEYKQSNKIASILTKKLKTENVNPNDLSVINYNIGLLSLKNKNYKKADSLFDTHARHEKSYLVHLAKGITLLNLKADSGSSQAHFFKAITLAPESELAKIHFKIGSEYGKVDNYKRALQEYDEALSLDPSLYLAKLNQAIIYRKLEDYETSEKLYAELITQHPSFF